MAAKMKHRWHDPPTPAGATYDTKKERCCVIVAVAGALRLVGSGIAEGSIAGMAASGEAIAWLVQIHRAAALPTSSRRGQLGVSATKGSRLRDRGRPEIAR
jgi:hypothetical protein